MTHLFLQLGKSLRSITNRHIDVEIKTRWIPGHVDVAGNKKADKAAKEVAMGNREGQVEGDRNEPEDELPELLEEGISINPTAAKRTYKSNLRRKWADRLEGTERTVRMLKVDDTYLSLDFSKRATGLLRTEYTTLVQLRIGHFPTASYLYCFNLMDTPQCTNCYERTETIEHYLMNCTAHRAQQRVRDLALGAASRSLKALLTPGKATKHLMQYIYATGGGECRISTKVNEEGGDKKGWKRRSPPVAP
ncbi:hypothetical protein BDV93DRAFT_583984 [Ceratobasidium sp. AG-I]|nr:hypothetical protein BDV93DRAFT_583984 [Ceratobasidium sp. AG-I]